jgi:RNA polymerase sigma-70 factor (ECF subfamily)
MAPGGGPSWAESEAAVADAIARARTEWPEIDVSSPVFTSYLRDRVKDPASLSVVKVSDLYAACACSLGDARALAAIAAIEARYFPTVVAALSKMRLAGTVAEDVRQELRAQVFVGAGDKPARIVEYTGRGDLRAWLTVIATRAALKVLRREKRDVHDDALLEADVAKSHVELSFVKDAYRAAFATAFREALEALEDRDKTLLRHQVIDELSIDQIGAIYRVHRATAARWLEHAREKLVEGTRTRFMQHARISESECKSLMRVLHSELDVTIRTRLERG